MTAETQAKEKAERYGVRFSIYAHSQGLFVLSGDFPYPKMTLVASVDPSMWARIKRYIRSKL